MIYHQEQQTLNLHIKMNDYDHQMSKAYSYRSVDSPDMDYDVPNQQTYEFVESFLSFDDWITEDKASTVPEYQHHAPVYPSATIEDGGLSIGSSSSNIHLHGSSNRATGFGQAQNGKKEKVAFKTKSQVEILDDGFKWRKYGKKMVKNSPNPRNYYRCSAAGCSVKKRVERDVEDARYVITTYEGIHNHQRPSNY
ncbi:unnamed protein product [Lactuca virosa]|uniref:WRKY domain-containing protein n=1 Tax=Lactuca virosa TaxID=75947 RepID=A0AAU9PHF4_9ASTR|nr:unnamed protein product [Lactuca virosa]